MHTSLFSSPRRLAFVAAVCSAWLAAGPQRAAAQPADPAAAPAAAVELPPGAQDVVKLTQAGLNEDVIIAQLRSAGFIYRLTADQIIALTNAGVSQNVIKALIAPAGSPPPVPVLAAAADSALPAPASPDSPPSPPPAAAFAAPVPGVPPAAPVNFDQFQSQLSAYGMWIQVSDLGWAWVPSEAAGNPGWQPYADGGAWVYTDLGWYWNSTYAWGGIPFHYGRWVKLDRYGWAWTPDYTWGPAWVCWRYDETDGFCGWAPLPPGARFVPGLGLYFHGRLALDIDFGLRWEDFVFCGYGHLLDRNVRSSLLPRVRIAYLYNRSFVRNSYAVVNGRFAVEGLGRARLEVLTHRDLRPVALPPGREDHARIYPQPRDPSYRMEGRPVSPAPGLRPVGAPYLVRPASPAPAARAATPPPERRPPPPPARAVEPSRSTPPPANSNRKENQAN
jgi:hypothetical protein